MGLMEKWLTYISGVITIIGFIFASLKWYKKRKSKKEKEYVISRNIKMVTDQTNFWDAVDNKFKMPMDVYWKEKTINDFPSNFEIVSLYNNDNIKNPIIYDILIYNNGSQSIFWDELVEIPYIQFSESQIIRYLEITDSHFESFNIYEKQNNKVLIKFEKWVPWDGIKFRIIVESINKSNHLPKMNIKLKDNLILIFNHNDGNSERRNTYLSYEGRGGSFSAVPLFIFILIFLLYKGTVLITQILQNYFENNLDLMTERALFLSWTIIICCFLLLIIFSLLIKSFLPKKSKVVNSKSIPNSGPLTPWENLTNNKI